jgi:DHA2 family multidrug resistance protein-like MFS transporter
VLVLPCLLVSMDAHVLNLAVPMIVADLRPGSAQLLWIVDGYVFLVAGALLAMGALGDRIGRRRLLLIGVTLFSAASLAAARADTPDELIAARVVMGLAGASLMPSTLALIRGMFADRRERTVAIGVWTASFSLGGLLAPLVGGLLLERFWWGSVFLLAVPVTLLLLALGPALLPEFRDRSATGFDVLGAAQSLVALLAFVYGIKRAAEGGDPAPIAAAVLLGAACAAAFVRRQRRTARPMIDPALFRGSAVRVALVSITFTFFVLYATQVATAQYLQWGVGLTALQAGLWTLPAVLAYLAASALGPAAVRRFPPVTVIGAGLAMVATGCVLLALVAAGRTGTPGDLAVIVAGGILFSVGLAPVYTLATEQIVGNAPAQQAGTAGAVAETGAELGGAMGIALLGSLGVAVYRHAMSGNAEDLPAGVATAAQRTFGDAVTVAGGLPAARGDELLEHARSAFEQAFATITGTAALLVAITAAAVLIGRRIRRRRDPDDRPAGSAPATTTTRTSDAPAAPTVTTSRPGSTAAGDIRCPGTASSRR